MFINTILTISQKIFNGLYNKSVVLKNLDSFIFINIILLILSTMFLASDAIANFAIFSIILTVIKLLVKPRERFILVGADKFLLLYFIFVLISVAGSSLFLLSFKGFLKTLIYLGFYITVVHYLKDNIDKIKYIFLAMTFSLFSESIIALQQNFLSVSEISGWQDMSRLNPEEVMTRVYGTLKPYNPNLFGGYLLMILPASLPIILLPFLRKNYKFFATGLIVFILGALSIVMTGCRGAYIGFFFEIILIGTLIYKFLKPFYKKIYLKFSSFLFVCLTFIMFSITSIRSRIFSIFAMRNDSSNSFRFNVYNSCIDMFKDNWLLGVGVGNQNFREIYGLYMKTGFDALSAYNIYLEIAVESGIFALVTFLAFIVAHVIRAVKYILKSSDVNTIYLSTAIISIFGVLVHGLVDTVFLRPQIQFLFWIMIAIIKVITCPRGVYDKK